MSLLTVREIKERTAAFFASRGVPNAQLDTDLLLAHVLGLQRLELYLDLDRPLSTAQLDALRECVRRRAKREPLQYILGAVEFHGLELKVDARALIPRHETEELIGYVIERLTEPPRRILDLGTGSGALACALAVNYPDATVVAVDKSAEALSLAKENANALGLEARVQFYQGSWFDPLNPEDAPYDLIVSNPPYLTPQEMATAEPEVTGYEPHDALVSGDAGLDAIRQIFSQVGSFLSPRGLFALETGIDHQAELEQLSQASGLRGECLTDLSDRPRFYLAHLPWER